MVHVSLLLCVCVWADEDGLPPIIVPCHVTRYWGFFKSRNTDFSTTDFKKKSWVYVVSMRHFCTCVYVVSISISLHFSKYLKISPNISKYLWLSHRDCIHTRSIHTRWWDYIHTYTHTHNSSKTYRLREKVKKYCQVTLNEILRISWLHRAQ